MAQSTSCDLPEVQELQHSLDVLKKHGYIPVPAERYHEMMLFCAEHNKCGFYMMDEDEGYEMFNQ